MLLLLAKNRSALGFISTALTIVAVMVLAGCASVQTEPVATSGASVPAPDPAAQRDPQWWSSSTVADGRFLVKFAWSRPAARRLAIEIGILTALGREPRAVRAAGPARAAPGHHALVRLG